MHAIRQPFMLLGPPGVGKSALFQQAAKRLGIGFIDFRLIYFDPVDLRGIPMPDLETGTTRWMTPAFFPRDGEGIILMEELTSAPTATQASAYQLTHDRRLGEYVLPPGWSVMAAGNRQNDRAVANRMPSALVSRFNMQELEHNNDDFQAYAATTDLISWEICAFLRTRPDCLMNFEPKTWKDNEPFACPRTWEYLSRALLTAKGNLDLDVMSGFVGPGAAVEFFGYRQIYNSIPTAEEIIANPTKAKVPTDPASLYAIATVMARKITADTADAIFTYIARLEKEYEFMFVRDAQNRNMQLVDFRAFNNWLAKNHKFFSV